MRRKRQYIVLSFASTARAMGWEKEGAAQPAEDTLLLPKGDKLARLLHIS